MDNDPLLHSVNVMRKWCLQAKLPKTNGTINLRHWEATTRDAIEFAQIIAEEFAVKVWLYEMEGSRCQLAMKIPYKASA